MRRFVQPYQRAERRGRLACARVTLVYDRTGSGPPLLLVHGLGSCKEMWRPLIPRLAREHDVVAVDMPGFGASPAGPTTVEGLAEALAAFTSGLGLERPTVAGNSLGGAVALVMGEMGAAGAVCGVSPAGYVNKREGRYAQGVLVSTRFLAERLAPVADRMARSAVMRTVLSSHVAARPWRIPPEDTAHWTRMYAGAPAFWDLLEALDEWIAPRPTCPTTIAWGEKDRLLIYSRQAPRARRALPEARHVTLHGCGHVPTWDDPEQVAAVITQAARSPRPRASAAA
jgi:pimeloyl-ACP methyl ester carboxylesterase